MLSIGAATLADIYEPHERGTMMGIYYAAPLLGPSLGPLMGGVLTQLFNWRATFYFLAIFGGVSLATFTFFKDTFRRERSLAYQAALKNNYEHESKRKQATTTPTPQVSSTNITHDNEKKDESSDGCSSEGFTPNLNRIKLSLRDVNPISPLKLVLQRKNNIVILLSSGKQPLEEY